MYHTEVYLDRTTYFSKGHIWAKVMLFQGAFSYLWYVSKEQRMDGTEIERRMSFFMREELVGILEKGAMPLQKALKRLLGGLGGGELHLCYGGQFYSSSGDMQKGMVIFGNGKGVYGSKSLENLFTEFGVEEMEKELSQKTVEEMASEWKVRLLKSMMQEDFKDGYLLVWEEKPYVV